MRIRIALLLILASLLMVTTFAGARSHHKGNHSGGGARTATAAATRFYQAWRHNDRKAARRVASSAAIADLFKTNGHDDAPEWAFQGCKKHGKGYDCQYSFEGGATTFHVKRGASKLYRVVSISSVAD